jgi:G3E family GTPase
MKNKLYLINGPLGAGKTTLLKFMLRQKQLSGARVIENEFASVSVDTEELHDHINEIETIAGLCICCSTGTELIDALNKLRSNDQPVIIEATGVANSLKLIEKLVVNDIFDHYKIAGAYFVIDAAEVSLNPYLLETHKDELEAADIVIISKTDLLNEKQKAKVIKSIDNLAGGTVVAANMGVFDSKLMDKKSRILKYFAASSSQFSNHDNDTNYTLVDTSALAIDSSQLQVAWTKLKKMYGLSRLKGNFKDKKGKFWHVEATPSQFAVNEQESSSLPQLVFIGSNARAITKQI